jgi:hypothetical protein
LPLTPAHVIAAWPISRLAPRLSLSALIIGSLSPDFEYLLRLAPISRFSHTLIGVLGFCLPTSLAIWWLFRAEVAPALATLLPERMRARLQATDARPRWRDLGWVLVALALGAVSHLAWDACTHSGGWLASTLPALRAPLLPALTSEVCWSQVLQHGSTVLGLGLLLAWSKSAWNRLARQAGKLTPAQAARIWHLALGLLAISLAGAVLNGSRAWGQGAPPVLGLASVGAMVGLAVVILGFTTMFRLAHRDKGP